MKFVTHNFIKVIIIEYWHSKCGEAVRIHKKNRMLLQQKINSLLQPYPILMKFYYCDILTSDYKTSDKDTERPQCKAPVFTSVP